jgi:hypothetical protein
MRAHVHMYKCTRTRTHDSCCLQLCSMATDDAAPKPASTLLTPVMTGPCWHLHHGSLRAACLVQVWESIVVVWRSACVTGTRHRASAAVPGMVAWLAMLVLFAT